ncbi:MAG: Type II secretion system protein G precursor [Smithella sp. PtaU1.Bin162]|nr:MAG: Type II secretion system protein G precursor [Smithella sp. PtaU1.Bin162]
MNNKGFTLIEIIAVLVILGILAAVAVPKYLDMAAESRRKAAEGAIAEIKGRLSQAQGKYILANGAAPTSPQLYTYATTGTGAYNSVANLNNVGSDFTVTTSGAGAPISISVTAVQGSAVSVSGSFTAAGD